MAAWLGQRLLGRPLPVVHQPTQLPPASEACILNYSAETIAGTYHIYPQGLLHQHGLKPQPIEMLEHRGMPMFFAQQQGQHPFDVLAASFFLISRYEEYLPHQLDSYGRFAHTASLAWQQGFLHRPLVDEWVMHFRQCLQAQYPDLKMAATTPGFTPTYDVDVAWSYQHKGLVRTLAGYANDARHGRWDALGHRTATLLGLRPDPAAIFEPLQELHAHLQLSPIYFFLLADSYQGYDRNISITRPALQQLVSWLHQECATGIHYSWAASTQSSLMEAEAALLRQWTKQPVVRNRMHYIRFALPHTFQRLVQAGITNDYSMGYGSINGFRASTSYPFYWYDLEQEVSTRLLIFPFAWMDANSIFEQRLSPEEALQEAIALYHAVRNTGGQFITIAHNHLLTQDSTGHPWWMMYNQLLRYIAQPT